jgi:hypothetical protein
MAEYPPDSNQRNWSKTMTSNRTIKPPIKCALVVATTVASTAWMGNAYADDASKTAVVSAMAPTQTAITASNNQIFDLRAFGDRFRLAIKAVEEEANKPGWGWEDDCDEDEMVRVAKWD